VGDWETGAQKTSRVYDQGRLCLVISLSEPNGGPRICWGTTCSFRSLMSIQFAYEGPGQKYGEYSVVPCKALYLQGTLLAEQLRRSGPVARPPYRLL